MVYQISWQPDLSPKKIQAAGAARRWGKPRPRRNLQANQQVLQEISDQSQRDLKEEQRKNKLLDLERLDLIQEGREWSAQRDLMAALVKDAAEEAKCHREFQQNLDPNPSPSPNPNPN